MTTDYGRMERIASEAEGFAVTLDGERCNLGAVIRALYTDHRRAVAASDQLSEAVKVCLKAERERRKKLKDGAPASTYTEARIAKLEAALAKAEGRA